MVPLPRISRQGHTRVRVAAIVSALRGDGWGALVRDGESWYVPSDGPKDRFVAPPGSMLALHLIPYQNDLRLCEDRTGLLVGPTDRRLAAAGLYVTNLRGERHYLAANRQADTRPGQPLRLVPEPGNPHDPHAIAVHPERGDGPLGYVNKQKARAWSKVLAQGIELRAISLRGTAAGKPALAVAVLAAAPAVVEHLLSPRPTHLPTPVFLSARQ